MKGGSGLDIHEVRQMLRTKSIYDIPLRVTYYARVSSETDEQLNSLDNQVSSKETQNGLLLPGMLTKASPASPQSTVRISTE